MVKKDFYVSPECEIEAFSVEESSLIMTSTGASSGEDATWGTEFNPW